MARTIAEILSEAEATQASIDDCRAALHDAEKRLESLQVEAERAVKLTFRGVGEKRPKNTRKTNGVSDTVVPSGN